MHVVNNINEHECYRTCDYNHPCNKPCFMDCGQCTEQMLKTLPCNHILTLPCFVNTVTFPCEEEVSMINFINY